MEVRIVIFPKTRVAALAHRGPPSLEHGTLRSLIAWKLDQKLLDPARYRSYGIHYTDPKSTAAADHHVEFCLSVDRPVDPNPYGIVEKTIPQCRCALARDIGSRHDNQAAVFLYETWLPRSGETVGDFPIFFHYVNVGPSVHEKDMLTDVYLPLHWPMQ